MTLRPTRTYSREWPDVTDEEREDANASIDAAIASTSADHPDASILNPTKP
jgi:hypothetical protein